MNEDHNHTRPVSYEDDCEICQQKAFIIREFFRILEIPVINSKSISGAPSSDIRLNGHMLYNILMDEEKLKILVSKLRLKAFW
jgi:hypothetical protein